MRDAGQGLQGKELSSLDTFDLKNLLVEEHPEKEKKKGGN